MIIGTPDQPSGYSDGRERGREHDRLQQKAEQDIEQGSYPRRYCDLCYAANGCEVVLTFVLVLPTLLQDIKSRTDKWGNGGKNGRIDSFIEVYDVSFFSRHTFYRIGAEFALSARFPHDRSYDRLSRPGEERG